MLCSKSVLNQSNYVQKARRWLTSKMLYLFVSKYVQGILEVFSCQIFTTFLPLFHVVALHWLLVVLARHLHDSIDCGQAATPLLPILWKMFKKMSSPIIELLIKVIILLIGPFNCKNVSPTPLHPKLHCKVIIGRNPIEANANTVAIQLPGNPVAYIGKCFTPY